ncbi:MAG: hypothetical protein V1754_04670, partial [Pseudomonadota bacterium]
MNRLLFVISLGTVLSLAGPANAFQGFGKGRGTGGSKMCKCGKVLLQAHPEMLQKKWGWTDEQISRIRKNTVNFFEKKISLRSQIDLLG